jgi:hypothetical protein
VKLIDPAHQFQICWTYAHWFVVNVSARVILTPCDEVKVTHLGEYGGFLEAADVDPGASSGDTSNGPTGRRDQGDCEASRVLTQHGAAVFA